MFFKEVNWDHAIFCRCGHSRSRHVYRADDWFECGSCNECKKFAEEVDYAT